MKEVNFNEWMVYKNPTDTYLEGIIELIVPYKKYLPNFEEFIIWYFDYEEGYFYEGYRMFLNTAFDFIRGVEDKFKEYSNLEQMLYSNIIVSYANYCVQCSSSGKICNYNKYTDDKGGKKIDLSEIDLFEIADYFKIKASMLNVNLPFIIENDFNRGIKIEPNADYKETSSEEETEEKSIKPIKMELSQVQIAYLFIQLVKNGYINENLNPTLWNLVSKYFVDKDYKPLNNIHQTINGMFRNKESKPRRAVEIEKAVKGIDEYED